MSQKTTRVRAAAVMLQRYDFHDDFSVIKSLTEGNKNPTVPSATEKLKPCSHLFIISEHARSQRRSPMAISVLPWFKLLAYTPRSTDLPKLFLESEMEWALWFGLVDGKWDLVRYQLVVLWSILAVTWKRCTRTHGVTNAVRDQALVTHSHSRSCRIDCMPQKGHCLKMPLCPVARVRLQRDSGYIDFCPLLPDTEQYSFQQRAAIPILGPGQARYMGYVLHGGLPGPSHLAGDRWFSLSADCSLKSF